MLQGTEKGHKTDAHLLWFYQNRSWLADGDRLKFSSGLGIYTNAFDGKDELIMNEANYNNHSPIWNVAWEAWHSKVMLLSPKYQSSEF